MYLSTPCQDGKKSPGDIMAMMEKLLHLSILEPRMGLVSPVSFKYCHLRILQSSNVTVAGDVVGCGIDFVLRKAFFTKNGAFLGESTRNLLLMS